MRLVELNVVYFLCVNLEAIDVAFGEIADHILTLDDYETSFPFIHISAHGSKDGLELTDGDSLYWDQLTNRIDTLNSIVGFLELPPFMSQTIPRVGLSLSSCSAFENYVAHDPENLSYQCVIGPSEEVGWCQSLIAFSTFYYRSFIAESAYLPSVIAMNLAAGIDDEKDFIFKIQNNHPEIMLPDSSSEASGGA